jgi:hypothetical protein
MERAFLLVSGGRENGLRCGSELLSCTSMRPASSAALSLWLRSYGRGAERAHGGVKYLSLRSKPMGVGSAISATAFKPQEISPFANSLFNILHVCSPNLR